MVYSSEYSDKKMMVTHNSSVNNFAFVFIVYIVAFGLTVLSPLSVLFLIFAFAMKDTFLALRIAIISTVALINNQFVISSVTSYFYEQKSLHIYAIGILFYFIVFNIIRLFSQITLTKELKIFIFLVVLAFLMSYSNIFGSVKFVLNVIGGFLGFFLLVNTLIKKFNYCNLNKFAILERDFFFIVVTILLLSFAIIVVDIVSDFEYLKMQAQALSSFRGHGEVKLLHGIPRQYTTGFFNIDFIIRYTSLINDPLRGAYWYLYLSLFLIGVKVNEYIKTVMILILFLFLISCWSKGAFLSMFFITIFYFLYRYKYYKFAIFFFVMITLLFIYLSGILKTSAAVHVLGLLLPFKADIDFHYFFGNNLFQAGNMGKLESDSWMDLVKRGAESLVGTYMYALGLTGVAIYLKIHYETIKILNRNKIYILASIVTVGAFVSFLQEGQYNVLQVFSLCILAFFLIGRHKLKEIRE